MNVFEDLIEELKESNLLEETVIEQKNAENAKKAFESAQIVSESNNSDFEVAFNNETIQTTEHEPFQDDQTDEFSPVEMLETVPVQEFEDVVESQYADKPQPEEEIGPDDFQIIPAIDDLTFAEDLAMTEFQTEQETFKKESSVQKPPVNEKEFYRKRAIEEVSGLQMVEHVLSGVEREQMKIVPKPFDDLAVKKTLHDFLQVSNDLKSPDHAQAEFQLMQETESWYSALSHRDKHVSVAHLRRYCETTRPVLSSQAMISLARFYRNSPFSESVRSKFDLIVTRLFSQDVGSDRREMILRRDELIEQLKDLYADWASIPLYTIDEDDSDILITTLKFEDFITEAGHADSFDELVKYDFFNRLRNFKESTNETFFAPLVTATAIESNVRIGNRYVELLEKEKEKSRVAELEDKYGFLHDQAISDATSKTLQLVELLKVKADDSTANTTELITVNAGSDVARSNPKSKSKEKPKMLAVSKWLIVVAIITILGTGSLYVWMQMNPQMKESVNVKKVNLENSSLKEYLEAARINSETFIAVVTPAWNGLSREKKEELLKKILSIGDEKGFKKVHLLNKSGKTVGSASGETFTLLTP